jgi:hypothetical protein
MSVSALSAGAYTATLYVMVNVVKGCGRAPPLIFHHDGMYARKRPLPLCAYSEIKNNRKLTKKHFLFKQQLIYNKFTNLLGK